MPVHFSTLGASPIFLSCDDRQAGRGCFCGREEEKKQSLLAHAREPFLRGGRKLERVAAASARDPALSSDSSYALKDITSAYLQNGEAPSFGGAPPHGAPPEFNCRRDPDSGGCHGQRVCRKNGHARL